MFTRHKSKKKLKTVVKFLKNKKHDFCAYRNLDLKSSVIKKKDNNELDYN